MLFRSLDAAKEILRRTGHTAAIQTAPNMPTGPLNRVADNQLAKRLLGWEPRVPFLQGLERTIEWYFSAKDQARIRESLAQRLVER